MPANFVVLAPYDGLVMSSGENWLRAQFSGQLLELYTAQQLVRAAVNPFEQLENICRRIVSVSKWTLGGIGFWLAFFILEVVVSPQPRAIWLAVILGIAFLGYGILMLMLPPGRRAMWRPDDEWKRLSAKMYGPDRQ